MMLTEHFTLDEFVTSQNAARCGISNKPDAETQQNLVRLANVMEEVRAICGDNEVTITSGYRCLEVNSMVGGARDSHHCQGLAVDFIIPGFGSPYKICKTLEPFMAELGIDQLIYEFDQWVHLGLSPNDSPRCQCLTINTAGTHIGF